MSSVLPRSARSAAWRTTVGVLAVTALLASCGDDPDATSTSEPTGTAPTDPSSTPDPAPTTTVLPDLTVTSDAPFPAARCAANRAAGTIVYLSSFDFAASASIIDVLVADAKGYYADLCLDVEIRPSFSVSNYPLIASNEAQFSSSGSFSEMVDFAGANAAGFVALAVEGRTGIDALITLDPTITSPSDLAGRTIGVKGAVTASVRAMLADVGLVEGEQYRTVLLDGSDPLRHAASPGIAGFPVHKSNEPGQLETAGVPFGVLDPSDFGVPGSFGILYSNTTFLADFPTAAHDFMRATMRGLADAIAEPAAAAAIAVEAVNASGNAMLLTAEGEAARWVVEAALVAGGVTSDAPLGLPVLDLLMAEVEAYAAVGLFGGVAPDIRSMVDDTVLARLYDGNTIIWPSG
jgi:NitT/TauT family transport system substrate-binding protein